MLGKNLAEDDLSEPMGCLAKGQPRPSSTQTALGVSTRSGNAGARHAVSPHDARMQSHTHQASSHQDAVVPENVGVFHKGPLLTAREYSYPSGARPTT